MLAVGAACVAGPALAQDYPARPITIVVPFTAGGGVDAVARLLADKLRASLNQSVVVDNKPGASGMLGAQAVVKAPADGYTLLLGSAGETSINSHVYNGRMQYSPE
ncbi:MAG TPA: tripartite tricarboxylate transporter substrate-binding protein, partial [Ramlibacter sp.]|nr:tripartite tricarboxylate transporter substrate-binding protein [Ramlibacter sp.]